MPSSGLPTRGRAKSPAGPVRYGPFARLADRLSGRADGRRGIPPAPAGADTGRVATAHTMRLDQLRSARNDAIFRERQRFLTVTAPNRDALADARAALTEALASLTDVESRSKEEGAGVGEDGLILRQADTATPEQITEYRRSRDKTARIDGLRQRRDALRYRDPAAADTTLTVVAKGITDNDYRVELIGTTATSGSEQGRLALSTQRAEAVRQSLQQHGVPVGSFTSVRGVGTQWPSHVDDVGPDGTLLPGPAAQNRSVVIRVGCR